MSITIFLAMKVYLVSIIHDPFSSPRDSITLSTNIFNVSIIYSSYFCFLPFYDR